MKKIGLFDVVVSFIIGVVFAAVLFLGAAAENSKEKYDERCRDAGGVPLKSESKCLHPSAVIEVK